MRLMFTALLGLISTNLWADTDWQTLEKQLWQEAVNDLRVERQAEYDSNSVIAADFNMKYMVRRYGNLPAGERPLFISMHGGGQAPSSTNDSQWLNQITLYRQMDQPNEGIYVAPRAPTDTWNMWHRDHIDPLFARLITNMVLFEGVDPNRVYIMGYSAGGDGTYQLAPRMADYWAGGFMSAGHPGNASPLNLRNLPFAIYVGGADKPYNRNLAAELWLNKLSILQKESSIYRHTGKIFPRIGHWMGLKDVIGFDFMYQQQRNPLPKTITWHQDEVKKSQMYWLAVDPADADEGDIIEASRKGQVFTIRSVRAMEVKLLLNHHMVDFEQEVIVKTTDGTILFAGLVNPTRKHLEESFKQRPDPKMAFSAAISVNSPSSIDHFFKAAKVTLIDPQDKPNPSQVMSTGAEVKNMYHCIGLVDLRLVPGKKKWQWDSCLVGIDGVERRTKQYRLLPASGSGAMLPPGKAFGGLPIADQDFGAMVPCSAMHNDTRQPGYLAKNSEGLSTCTFGWGALQIWSENQILLLAGG